MVNGRDGVLGLRIGEEVGLEGQGWAGAARGQGGVWSGLDVVNKVGGWCLKRGHCFVSSEAEVKGGWNG